MSEAVEKRVKKPKSKARKIIEWVLFGVFGVAFAFVLIGNIDAMIHKNENYGQSIRYGLGTFVILTDSMEPDIKVNDAIITLKEDVTKFEERLNKEEIIDVTFANERINVVFQPDSPEFQPPYGECVVSNQIMTHRLREVHIDESVPFGEGRYIFVASGINYQDPDGEINYNKQGQYQLFTEKQYLGTVKVVNTFIGGFMNFVSSPFGLIILLLIPAGYLIVVSSMDIFKALKENEESQTSSKLEGDHLSNISDKEKERLKKEMLEEMIKAKKEEKKNE